MKQNRRMHKGALKTYRLIIHNAQLWHSIQ